jgi:transposase-like protein
MDIKRQAVHEYLTQGFTYRQLAIKYGVSRSTINTWVLVHRGIHDLPRSKRQNSYDLQQMKQGKKSKQKKVQLSAAEQKIALPEKQLAWEKMRADTLDTMINIAEKELNIPIRKKPGFGDKRYISPNTGREVEWFKIGSPSKANFALYMFDIKRHTEALKKSGKHKAGGGCLYINKMEDIDIKVLEKMIVAALK